jgi:tRNA (cmo5U34)-methyltransferase
MVDEYHSLKRENGYTDDAIDLKRESLEGKLVPVTAAWNEDLIASAGWKRVERFWQWMNFAGWLAFKD